MHVIAQLNVFFICEFEGSLKLLNISYHHTAYEHPDDLESGDKNCVDETFGGSWLQIYHMARK